MWGAASSPTPWWRVANEMSDAEGPEQAPVPGRFVPGRSGNPRGRPKKPRTEIRSAFAIVAERQISFEKDGQAHQLAAEDALKRKTFDQAVAGNKKARRAISKWMMERERWIVENTPQQNRVDYRLERTADTANDALLLLGIVTRAPSWGSDDRYERFKLQPWAVQAALSRPGGRKLLKKDVREVERCTANPETLHWPKGAKTEDD